MDKKYIHTRKRSSKTIIDRNFPIDNIDKETSFLLLKKFYPEIFAYKKNQSSQNPEELEISNVISIQYLGSEIQYYDTSGYSEMKKTEMFKNVFKNKRLLIEYKLNFSCKELLISLLNSSCEF